MKSHQQSDTSSKYVIWFSRLLRWLAGSFFIAVGIWYYQEDAWPLILFGSILVLTGFLKPVRCINDGCAVPKQITQQEKKL